MEDVLNSYFKPKTKQKSIKMYGGFKIENKNRIVSNSLGLKKKKSMISVSIKT